MILEYEFVFEINQSKYDKCKLKFEFSSLDWK